MKKILIVEDDYSIREMFKTVFEDLEYEVATAKNGREGLDKVLHSKPDCVLLDISMPEMTGPEFAKKLKENADISLRQIPFVVLTGENYADPAMQYLFRGNSSCKAFLPKTADAELVVRTIQAVIGKD